MVKLLNSHIVIDKEIALGLFNNESYVQMIYYEQNGTLVMAKDSDDMFKSFHKAKREILKDKNLLGDKAVNIREFIIDHAIAETNRPLTYFADEAMHILNIYFE